LKSHRLLRKRCQNCVDHSVHEHFLAVVLRQKCNDVLLPRGVEDGRSKFTEKELLQFERWSDNSVTIDSDALSIVHNSDISRCAAEELRL
jgi:hypothetical protein